MNCVELVVRHAHENPNGLALWLPGRWACATTSFGELLEVYQRIETPDGEPLLFEIYQRQSAIDSRAGDVLGTLWPLVVVPLVVLLGIELTLAWRMARRMMRRRT